MAFLQRLKGKRAEDTKDDQGALKGVIQLEVDLYQTDDEIIVFAPIPGVKPNTLDVAIKGDDDIVVISGTRKRPEDLAFNTENRMTGTFFTEEVQWGDFFRKIILPERVDIDKAEAKIRAGVLVLHLPMEVPEEKKDTAKKLKVVDVDETKSKME